VKEAAECADWEAVPDNTCGKGMCASKMSLVWMPERQQAYVEQPELNLELQMQFEAPMWILRLSVYAPGLCKWRVNTVWA